MFRFAFPDHDWFIGSQFGLDLLADLNLAHVLANGAFLIYDGSN